MPELRLIKVWYIRHGDGGVSGVFLTEEAAYAVNDVMRGERYVRQAWLATVDGVNGYLVNEPDPLKVH